MQKIKKFLRIILNKICNFRGITNSNYYILEAEFCMTFCMKFCDSSFYEGECFHKKFQFKIILKFKDCNLMICEESILRSSRPEVFYKKGVLRNLAKFTEKQLCQSLFFNKGLQACNFIKKETLAQVFSCFAKFLRTTFFIEHLWWLLLNFWL